MTPKERKELSEFKFEGKTPEELAEFQMKLIKAVKAVKLESEKGQKFLTEWACQNDETIESLPEEILTLISYARTSVGLALFTPGMPVKELLTEVQCTIEAAYNFGKQSNISKE